jgi:hypothetical protein
LAHRAEPEVRVSEKWIRVPALNEALIQEGASDQISKIETIFEADAPAGGKAI